MKLTISFYEPTAWRASALRYLKFFGVATASLLTVLLVWSLSQAEPCAPVFMAKPCEVQTLANAIYKAEGGAKTSHPYGILAKYKHTTPRQACINTIKHAFRDWDGKGDFIAFLGSRYAPIGAKNDPHNLNANWVKNVTYLYNKEVAK